jgi:hypothetical protein
MLRKSLLALMALIMCAALTSSLSAQGIPKPGEQFTSITKDAIYTWYAEPKAIYYEGAHKRTYMAWNTSTGQKGIAYYDHTTQDTVVDTLPPMPYGADDHNHPAIIVRPDGKIIIFCTGHDGGTITELISKNPEDITSWQPALYPGGNGGYCYPNAIFLKGEGTQGRLYLFFRDNAGGYPDGTVVWEPCFCFSDDWGVTWSRKYHMFTGGSYKPYCKYASDDSTEIHVVVERENRQGNSAVKPIYFMKYKNGTFYCANGRQLATMATLPVHDYQMDTIFYANRFGCSNTCYDLALDANKNPVTVMDMFKDTSINIYWYMRWTGTTWFKTPFVNSGMYRGCQSGFAAGITLDHENPSNVYLCRQMLKPSATPFNMADTSYTNYKTNLKASCWTTSAYPHELEKWTTPDGGATWDTMPITRNTLSSVYMNTNCLPCVPRHHKAGTKIEVMWLNGIYQSMSPTPVNGVPGYQLALRVYPFLETVGTQPSGESKITTRASSLKITRAGIAFALVSPAHASLALYYSNGKLMGNFTPLIRGMNPGAAYLPFSALSVKGGVYIVKLDNGQSITTNRIVTPQ